ncbi:MAG: DUF2188 domain-containing protein [bacterium]|nr:DUF2188 domain-containing protein [bacterium]
MADYYLVEAKKANEWVVKLEGARCASAKCKTQDEAIAKAIALSKEKGFEKVVVKQSDGKTSTVKV